MTAAVMLAALAVAQPAPAFDTRDPAASLRWIVGATDKFAAAKTIGNELAIEAAGKAYDRELATAKGKRIEWPAEVRTVTKESVVLNYVAAHPFAPGQTQGKAEDAEVADHLFPAWNLAVSAAPVGDRTAAANLRPGDRGTVRGTVERIEIARRAVRGGDKVRVVVDCTVQLSGARFVPAK